MRKLVVVLLAVLAVLPLPAQQRQSREQELANIRAEIGRLTARLEAARKAQTGLKGEMEAVEVDLRLQETRLAEAAAARDLAARRVEEGEREVQRLAGALEKARTDLRRRLSALYRLGRQGYLRLFLSLKPDSRLLPSVRLMRYLARRDRVAIDRYQQAREGFARERELLVARREETEEWIRAEQARREQLAAVVQHKQRLLARLEKEGRVLAARTDELVDRERKLASFLDLLYGRTAGSPAGTPMQQFRGVLDWPVEGKVTTGFGSILDPRYKTKVPHNGVALAVSPGADVKAVFPGKVLYAAPFQGYGNTVIVQHPGRVFSLYAGLSGIKVGKEDMLSLGDAVGTAADRLYFEVRVENQPEDPLNWLR
ncbi:MAG TPA: peptidoglycan DD-metalloendopeptidase family protein [Thermoanaerobaculia bacterium]|nr:peptidoglycan DD-metalloendopeptidase family protein [Thermoanaerobaculia bacterium]